MSAEVGGPTASSDIGALDRRSLLRAAREAIAAHLASRDANLPAATSGLCGARGAFVTLRRASDSELRGCVGRLEAIAPLLETVAQMAVAAATRDSRFEPVSASELHSLRIEISVLSALVPIRPSEVELGRHGLWLKSGESHGVLLPQVPLEHGWDLEAFLAHTCEKAGLPADAWSRPGVELSGFTATVFGEDD